MPDIQLSFMTENLVCHIKSVLQVILSVIGITDSVTVLDQDMHRNKWSDSA